jgi:hypothetical protein
MDPFPVNCREITAEYTAYKRIGVNALVHTIPFIVILHTTADCRLQNIGYRQ